jgi:hypothetical protein
VLAVDTIPILKDKSSSSFNMIAATFIINPLSALATLHVGFGSYLWDVRLLY